MTRSSTAFASLFALALAAGAARAQAPRDGTAAALDGNVVGGGMAFHAQPGRAASFAGTDGDGPVVRYSAPADANPGREAWLLGGGDNAEVTYSSPYQRR